MLNRPVKRGRFYKIIIDALTVTATIKFKRRKCPTPSQDVSEKHDIQGVKLVHFYC